MTCAEWREGYSQGFSDGYEKAKRDFTDTKPYSPPELWPEINTVNPKPGCRVCGIKWDKPMGYVCPRSDCPSKITCRTGDDTVYMNPRTCVSYTYANNNAYAVNSGRLNNT